jgi:uncharacterized protein YecE (DUF72 family)
MAIYIGTSGWSYPTGAGTWNGTFYPAPRPKGFDELAYYARFFTFTEVNTTFYGQPRPEVAAKWAERTPAGFVFSLKLYQQFTHPRLFLERVTATVRKQLGDPDVPASALAALAAANQEDLDAFRRGIEPLANAGKLGPLLAQFPASFRDTPESRAHLAALLRAFGGYDVAVELRHRSWSDREAETRTLLEAFGAAWAWIDEPKFKDSIRQPDITTTPFAYLRLHGRNAQAWWRHAHRDDRYAYDYAAEELAPIAARLTAENGPAYVALNNHPNARSVANALMLLEQVGQPLPNELQAEVAARADRR